MLIGAVAGQTCASTDNRPMTFEEILRDGESLGDVRFSPTGHQFLASVEASARGGGFPSKLTGIQTFAWMLSERPGPPARAGVKNFTPAPCDPWSPSGRFVAGFRPKDGERRLVIWSPANGKQTVLPNQPTTSCPTWVGENLVFGTPPPTLPSAGAAYTHHLDYMRDRWALAGRSDTAVVTVHSGNSAFPSAEPAEGALLRANPATGRTYRLSAGTFHSIAPSPQGDAFAAVRLLEADPAALFGGRRGELSVFRLTSNGARVAYRLPDIDPDYAGVCWSADGSRLLVAGRARSSGSLVLTVVDLRARTSRRILITDGVRLGQGRRGAYEAFRPIGWIQDRPAFIAMKPISLPGPSDGHTDYGEGQNQSFGLFWDGPDGVRELTAFVRQSVTAFAAGPSGDGYIVADGALWAVGAKSPRRVSPEQLTVSGLAVMRPTLGLPATYAVADDRVLVTAWSGETGPVRATIEPSSGRLLAIAPAIDAEARSPRLDMAARVFRTGWTQTLAITGRRGQVLMTLNESWRSRPSSEVRSLTYTSGGRRLKGWIVLPPGYAGGPLPTIVWVYGGQNLELGPPDDALPGLATTPVFSGQLWAARGYAVLYPSLPFQAASGSDVSETLALETLAAIDAAVDQGLVDRDRVGIIGHSFGGFTTAAVLSKRPDRFRAGIAMSGAFDFSASWAERGLADELIDPGNYAFALETRGYVEHGQIGLGGPPWAAPGIYDRASPFFAVAQLKTPLLLTAGDLDLGSTSLLQSERMYAALRRNGNPAVLVRYWGQGHLQYEPAVVRDQWQRFGTWFDHYLKLPRGAAAKTSPAKEVEEAVALAP
ncbi:alpha/beta hydrolase family protein [Phenylobacterium sp.]|uniref:alpha/beta hydrolase family protein n=1 Tax=Phenylobacterium sp. TaxID=1871053 RepID=UPI00356B56BF